MSKMASSPEMALILITLSILSNDLTNAVTSPGTVSTQRAATSDITNLKPNSEPAVTALYGNSTEATAATSGSLKTIADHTDATNVTEMITEFVTEYYTINITEVPTEESSINTTETYTEFITEIQTVTEVATELSTNDTTEESTMNITETYTEFITEIQTVTEVATELSTNDTTEESTMNITETYTEFITELQTVTEVATELSTIDTTEIVSEIVTMYSTDIITDDTTEVPTTSLPTGTDYVTEVTSETDFMPTDTFMTTVDESSNLTTTRISNVTVNQTFETTEATATELTSVSEATPDNTTSLSTANSTGATASPASTNSISTGVTTPLEGSTSALMTTSEATITTDLTTVSETTPDKTTSLSTVHSTGTTDSPASTNPISTGVTTPVEGSTSALMTTSEAIITTDLTTVSETTPDKTTSLSTVHSTGTTDSPASTNPISTGVTTPVEGSTSALMTTSEAIITTDLTTVSETTPDKTTSLSTVHSTGTTASLAPTNPISTGVTTPVESTSALMTRMTTSEGRTTESFSAGVTTVSASTSVERTTTATTTVPTTATTDLTTTESFTTEVLSTTPASTSIKVTTTSQTTAPIAPTTITAYPTSIPPKRTTFQPTTTTTTTTDSATTARFSTRVTTASASTPRKEATSRSTMRSTTSMVETTTEIRMTTKRTVDDELKELEETPVTEENVEEVSQELAELTEDAEEMTSDGVETTAEILGNITALNSSEPEVTTAVVETVNNLMDVDEAQLEEAANEGATNMAVQSLEAQLQFVNVSASNGTYKDVQPNLGVQVSEYPPEELTEGLTFTYATNDPEGVLLPEHMIVSKGNSTAKTGSEQVQAQLFLPPSIGETIRNKNNTRVSFVLYRTTSLFPSRSLLASNKGKAYDRTSNTRIISASIDGMTISNLSEPVVTSYQPIIGINDTLSDDEIVVNITNPACVFWDFEADDGYGNWSSEGCQLVGTDNGTDDEFRCQCNHLTNFAVLMDIYGGSTLNEYWTFILDVMSYVGCSLSIFLLLVTLSTYLYVKKLRTPQPSRILMCLCTSLLFLYIFFIILASLKNVTMATCGTIVGFLHFSLLSSIAWMAVESFNMYIMVIKIFDRGAIQNFMKKAAVFTIGAPALIVSLTGGIAQQGYMRYEDGLCGFLTEIPMISGVLVPIGVVIIYDTIIFIMVIRRLSRKVPGRQVTKPMYKERLRRLQNASALIVLMGLTWAVGFLTAIEGASLAVQIIFIILNSLQGCFLFIFYCLRNPAARSLWRKLFCRCLPPVEESTTRGSSNGSRSRTPSTPDDNERKKWYHVKGKGGFYDLTKGGKRGKTSEASSTYELASESMVTSNEQFYRKHASRSDVTDDVFEEGIENGVETAYEHDEVDNL
ncbi:serine-rich adhesin for platelets-like [Lytechinus variegatus]|uniref:serine-rich adhesin for platelets-like n=1 Tax=Lytechinus variegatus TaxID=7654 RepID=UPI001BB1F751|nr:serine-rich adhesin for platelets-like [Lytechinus variegatus]